MFEIVRDRRKTLIKEKEKRKMRKSQTTTTNHLLTFTFLYRKIYLLLETHIEKLSLYCYICVIDFPGGKLLEMQ